MSNCKGMILHCMDFRIQTAVETWVKDQGFQDDVDRVAFAGSCLNGDFALEMIQASSRLHNIDTVFLTQHEECGAYGDLFATKPLADAKEQLVSDMTALRRRVSEALPNVQVRTLWVGKSGDNWIVEEILEEG